MNDRLIKYGVNDDIARACARNLAETSLRGVYSHGLNRFPKIISMIKKGRIKPNSRPERISSMSAFEVWDGKFGMGNTNAAFCMGRAVELARESGVACTALRHTNHWQRGGAFGIQAAESGCAAICWTTAMPDMPDWGSTNRRAANNPVIFCVPYGKSYVLFDGAMARFSGGIGLREIRETEDRRDAPEDEYGVNQIFIAINVNANHAPPEPLSEIIMDIKYYDIAGMAEVRYTDLFLYAEMEKQICEENKRLGIPVNEDIWNSIKVL
jgi:LDH2 family malate/lactate/ureidoglycolate dehydrogenase